MIGLFAPPVSPTDGVSRLIGAGSERQFQFTNGPLANRCRETLHRSCPGVPGWLLNLFAARGISPTDRWTFRRWALIKPSAPSFLARRVNTKQLSKEPPYNTGAKDWKYNNDYVDGEDIYRHSKWLGFMERRLKVAQKLLNPANSVLIVTIDEKEYLRLGLLLEQTFPEARVQMVSSAINPKGSPRSNAFSRVDEYLYFVSIGSAAPARLTNDMLSQREVTEARVEWVGVRRRGSGWERSARPGLFYPVFVDPQTARIVDAGEPLPLGRV